MTRVAALLRRLADRLDPPPPVDRLRPRPASDFPISCTSTGAHTEHDWYLPGTIVVVRCPGYHPNHRRATWRSHR